MIVLGTDGFGRSDTRAALRCYFEVDRRAIAIAALAEVDPAAADHARTTWSIGAEAPPPWSR
jgi:pyruvate dehydrogenase E1 component